MGRCWKGMNLAKLKNILPNCGGKHLTTKPKHPEMQRFLTQIESHEHARIIIFEVIHIEDILVNKAIYFNFKNMKALSDKLITIEY